MSAYGPDDEMRKLVVPADYDKDEYANEEEIVVLKAVDVSKECGSCPP